MIRQESSTKKGSAARGANAPEEPGGENTLGRGRGRTVQRTLEDLGRVGVQIGEVG